MWNSVGNFCYLVSQWLITYITTRIGGFQAAGILSIAMSFGATFASVANFTMRHFQASDVENRFSDSVYVWSRYATSIFSFIACVASAFIFGYDEFTLFCISIYMAFKITEAISDVYQGGMQKRMRMDFIGKAFLYKAACCLGSYIVSYQLSNDLALSLLIMTIVATLIVVGYERRAYYSFPDFDPSVSAISIVQLLLACFPLMIYGLCLSAVGQIPRLIIGARLGDELLGIYASIATPVTVIQVMSNYLFAPLTTPLATYYYEGNIKEFRKLFVRVFVTLLVVAFVSIICASCCGAQLLDIMFGKTILRYANALVPLVVCGILTAYVWFFANVLIVLRMNIALVSLSVASVIVSSLSSWFLVDAFGINGASFGLVISLAFFACGALASLFVGSRHESLQQS